VADADAVVDDVASPAVLVAVAAAAAAAAAVFRVYVVGAEHRCQRGL